MNWDDDAIVLAVRRHGESGVIASLLTATHGRHSGLVRGGAGKAKRGVLQPGNAVRAAWKARLAEHLGLLSCELIHPHAAAAMDDATRLACLASACAVAEAALPERQPHPAAYAGLAALLESLPGEAWPSIYVHWELAVLRELGFGLDLGRCAATGVSDGLAFVSPKTGRAVSASAGEPWRDKLLKLPAFLVTGGVGGASEVVEGLALTGFFLEKNAFDKPTPPARTRFVDRLRA
ncbi:MAG: DNA repair protein RecO [Alphaproteobacteria bacterium]|nr:DNA repair protein RecO [Alphaproteobacteria bacterium]